MTPRAICTIDLDALEHNVRAIRGLVGAAVQICGVVKANAYGHGAVPVARALVRAGVDRLAVTSLDEARELRQSGCEAPLLILSGIQPAQAEDALSLDVAISVWDAGQLRRLAEALPKNSRLPLHLKFDTGMRRLGADDAEALARAAHEHAVELEGSFSHLACADEPGHESVDEQIQAFHTALGVLGSMGLSPGVRHIANSAGVLSAKAAHLDMVRPGLLLYGGVPGRSDARTDAVHVKPVMELKTRILHIKHAPSGAGVGYGWTWKARRPTRLAVLPIGYGQGYPRRLSNRGEVAIRGRRAPVVGAVSMDHITIDVTDVEGAQTGDEVILWGGSDGPDVMDLAERAGTIGYELLTRVSHDTPRTYKGRNE